MQVRRVLPPCEAVVPLRFAGHTAAMIPLVRPRRGRVIAGVCAGLARRFNVPAWFVRLVFVLSVFLPGPQVIIYVILWILMPSAESVDGQVQHAAPTPAA